MSRRSLPFFTLFALWLFLSACTPAAWPPPADPPQADPAAPESMPTRPAAFSQFGVSFAYDPSLAAAVDVEIVPGTSANGPEPFGFDLLPDHLVFTLRERDAAENILYRQTVNIPDRPQILVFPLEAFKSINPRVYDQESALDLVVQGSPPPLPGDLPLLPSTNGFQMLRAQQSVLDFQNGRGLRYLTQYAQETRQVNNQEIFYTFQGLTADRAFYVAAFFPVSTGALPPDDRDTDHAFLAQNMEAYLDQTTAMLDALPASAFAPDLDLLDGLISSLMVLPTIDLDRSAAGADDRSEWPPLDSLRMEAKTAPSPDGRRQAIAARSAPELVGGREHFYTTLTVVEGGFTWTPIAEWRREGPEALTPTIVKWSRNSLNLYFTNSGSPSGCSPFINGTDFYRLDATSGAVYEILGQNSTVTLALSPDEKTLAYLGWHETGTVLALRDTITLQEERLQLPESAGYIHAGSLFWSPDGDQVLITAADDACGPQWAQSVILVDLAAGQPIVLIERDRRLFAIKEWASQDMARLTDLNGTTWWLDLTSGQLIREG